MLNDEHTPPPFIILADFYKPQDIHRAGISNPPFANGERCRENDYTWSAPLQVHSPCPSTPFSAPAGDHRKGGVRGELEYFSPQLLPVGHPGCVVAPARKPPTWPLCLQVWEPDPPLTLPTFWSLSCYKLSPNPPSWVCHLFPAGP